MTPEQKTQFQAAAFRTLVAHLQQRTDVQNIDMMNLAGFCRNCLSRWFQEAATQAGLDVSKDEARNEIYGMAYEEWRAKYQTEATQEQNAAFKAASAKHD